MVKTPQIQEWSQRMQLKDARSSQTFYDENVLALQHN